MAEERIQKILARAGYGSRRASEVLIAAGRVRVNGIVAVLGAKADPEKDQIMVDGQVIPAAAPAEVYIALHKPRFVLSDNTSEDPRKTVFDLVPLPGPLFVVGRLDFESEGLILLTNDGELTNKLTHPRYGHEKEYRVLVAKRPDDEQLAVWRRGVVLEDGRKTSQADVRIESSAGKGAWLRILMREGRKRQIREICGLIGLPVVRIVRTRIGTVQLGGLKPGEWRNLTPLEIRNLKDLTANSEKKPIPAAKKPAITRKETNRGR
jgi:23S rRNA pseudouridine2605 synthase